MRPVTFLSSIVLFTAAGTAWPSGWNALDLVVPLAARAEASKTSYDLSYSATQGNTATTETSSATATGSNPASSGSAGTTTGKDAKTTGQTTGTATTGSESSTNKTSSYETTKTFDARLPAGGIEMISPAVTADASYYKIGNYVTFAWNYTSLSVTPSAVDILASCSLNSATYTLALNASITGPTQAVTWDTGAYQATATLPLLTETYTLIIYDADSSVSATAQAGYLAVYDQYTFGMYTPQPYTPLTDYVCATCNSAISSMEKQTLGFMLGMVAVTVLSFGWFSGLVGLW